MYYDVSTDSLSLCSEIISTGVFLPYSTSAEKVYRTYLKFNSDRSNFDISFSTLVNIDAKCLSVKHDSVKFHLLYQTSSVFYA